MYNMTCVIVLQQSKVTVSNFKVENAFYVFTFFDMTLQKT